LGNLLKKQNLTSQTEGKGQTLDQTNGIARAYKQYDHGFITQDKFTKIITNVSVFILR